MLFYHFGYKSEVTKGSSTCCQNHDGKARVFGNSKSYFLITFGNFSDVMPTPCPIFIFWDARLSLAAVELHLRPGELLLVNSADKW